MLLLSSYFQLWLHWQVAICQWWILVMLAICGSAVLACAWLQRLVSLLQHCWCIRGSEAKIIVLKLSHEVPFISLQGKAYSTKRRLSLKEEVQIRGLNYRFKLRGSGMVWTILLCMRRLRSLKGKIIKFLRFWCYPSTDLGSKKCNLIIRILAINGVGHKYLATRNATYCVLLYFPSKSDVKDPVTQITS